MGDGDMAVRLLKGVVLFTKETESHQEMNVLHTVMNIE